MAFEDDIIPRGDFLIGIYKELAKLENRIRKIEDKLKQIKK